MYKNYLIYSGLTKPLADWADSIGINRTTLHSRIYKLGWPTEKALQKDVGAYTKRMKSSSVVSGTKQAKPPEQQALEGLLTKDCPLTGCVRELAEALAVYAGKDLTFNVSKSKYHLLQDPKRTLHKIEKAFEVMVFQNVTTSVGCGRMMLNPGFVVSVRATDLWERLTGLHDEMTWYDIPGFDGAYQIAKNSNVRSVDRVVNSVLYKGRMLTVSGGFVYLYIKSEHYQLSIRQIEKATNACVVKKRPEAEQASLLLAGAIRTPTT